MRKFSLGKGMWKKYEILKYPELRKSIDSEARCCKYHWKLLGRLEITAALRRKYVQALFYLLADSYGN